MAPIPFAAWRPDIWSTGSPFAGVASGVLPRANSYGPWPSLASTSLAVADVVRGAIVARLTNGNTVVYCGTATKLYRFAGIATSWADMTRASGGDYAVPADGFWSFAQFGKYLIAVNGVDAPQVIDVDAGSAFAALGGSPPIARYVKVVGDFVWLIDLSSAVGPSAPSGRVQIQWSGFRKHDHWTPNSRQSDFATFPSGGFVQGCSSQLGGIVFLERQIWPYVRSSVKVFDFAPIQEEQGVDAPNSIVSHEQTTYFHGTDGFSSIGPQGIAAIGNEWVDNWFLEACNPERVVVMQGALDPLRMRIFWLFASTSNASSVLDRIICYDILNKERPWTEASDVQASVLFQGATPGATLSDLESLYGSVGAVPYPLGSRVWVGGAPLLAAFDGSYKLAFFNGAPLEATVQTSQFQPIPGRRGFVNGFRVLGDAATVTGRSSYVERTQDTETWKASGTLNAQGVIPQRGSGKYMRAEVTIPAGTDWDHLHGIEFMDDDVRDDGVK